MDSVTIQSFAKVNLFLDIVAIRKDGYHDLVMVNTKISLCDVITCELVDEEEISIQCEDPSIPRDESNTVFKAASLFLRNARLKKGVRIHLDKNIPVGAGLGGGSSNAASVLMALNDLIAHPLSQPVLVDIAKGIGADVPFFLASGCCLIKGIGETIVEISVSKSLKKNPPSIVLCSPSESISTKEAYALWDQGDSKEFLSPAPLLCALLEGRPDDISPHMFNAFEPVIYPQHPAIRAIYETFAKIDPVKPMLTGSGSNMFSVHVDEKEAIRVMDKLKKEGLSASVWKFML